HKEMTLPPSYITSKEYVTDSLSFLKSFSMVFNNFPRDWLAYFNSLAIEDMNSLALGGFKLLFIPIEVTHLIPEFLSRFAKFLSHHRYSLNFPLKLFFTKFLKNETCPSSLKAVLHKIESLKPKLDPFSQKCAYDFSHNSGLSKKKLHEVVFFAPLIDTICKRHNADTIIDIGSGLGYLSHLLNDYFKYPVLGIECDSEKVTTAYRNQIKYFPNSRDKILKNSCIVGLHACADLSITILDLFTKLDFVNCLVIMPCCYHRIEFESVYGGKEYFKHFPASQLFKDMWENSEAENFIRRPFLRLACQQSVQSFLKMTGEEHTAHARSCMHRAVLQKVVESANCNVTRLKRKSGKTRFLDADEDFQAYLDNLRNTHQLNYQTSSINTFDTKDERFLKMMHDTWIEQKDNCQLMEVLTAFQASLQGVCENLILLDRVEFLKEKGFKCYVQKVTDDSISPRCFALVAVKSKSDRQINT
ncbi:hypothetical protein NQ318_008626, partial [Aromia moschata]